MTRTDQLRAELELAELEDQLTAAKAAKTKPEDLRELKHQVRAARQAHREGREG
jgi:hypothetical protein